MGEADGYRLAPVREGRARDEKLQQGKLASAVGDANKTQAAIAAADARVAALQTTLAAARTAAQVLTRAADLVLAERHLTRLRRDLDAALDERERALAAHAGQQAVVDAARLRLARARADKELVERHFARWRDEKRKLAERRED